MASAISDGLSCPVCFVIPEAEVYQCENEHWLCRKCYFQITPPLCPECRTRLDRDRPRRCKTIERVLDGIKIDCAFESNGCDKRLSRGSVQGHQAECTFNFDKFGQFVNLCKSIGYQNCAFKFNNESVKEAVEHFVSKHGCILTTSEKYQMELVSFKESAKAEGGGFHFWTPIIADIKEQKCYLLTMVVLNKEDASFTWLSIFLPYANNKHRESSPVEIEYTVKTIGALSFKVWVERPMSLREARTTLPNKIDFVNYSLPYVRHCSKEGRLLMECNIRRHGVKVPTGSENPQIIVCTRNINTFSGQTSTLPVRFYIHAGSPAAMNFRSKLLNDCESNRDNLFLSIGNLFEGEKPACLTEEDVEWLKTDLLFATAEYGNVEALEYLTRKELYFNIVDGTGRAPLHYTMFDKDKIAGLEKAKRFIDAGIAAADALDDLKWSALHYAASSGNNAGVEYFLREGCDVNAKDRNSFTPLYWAVSNSSEEEGLKVVKSLVAKGADLSIIYLNGEKAFDIAKRLGKAKITQLLHSYQSN